MITIHPTALIHPGAEIGDNVHIGPYVIVENNVHIGEATRIESSNRIASGARIGRNCSILHGAAIATAPQDPEFRDEDSLAFIGDNTAIREFVTVNRGTANTGKTVIGANCMVMAYCHIAHDCSIGDNVIIANGVQTGGRAELHDFAIIGGMTAISASSRIGKYCMISGSVFVTRDVPPYSLAGREPLVREGLNSIGLRRRNFPPDAIRAIDAAYAILYDTGSDLHQALTRIQTEMPQIPEIIEITAFANASINGLVPMGQS